METMESLDASARRRNSVKLPNPIVLKRYGMGHVVPRATTVHRLFEEQVARTPEASAVEHAEESISYAELNSRADRLAECLRSRGVGPDVPVALFLERSPALMIGLLSILKAGGAYVPLDPSLPRRRLALMMSDAACAGIIVQDSMIPLLPIDPDDRGPEFFRLTLDDGVSIPTQGRVPDFAPPTEPDDLAYVLFTSGSTGQPKGVEMPHRALVNLIEWQRSISGMKTGHRTLQFAGLGFDVSFQEIFSTWAVGGTLVLIDDDSRKEPEMLLDVLNDSKIDRVFLPVVMLERLAEAAVARGNFPVALKEVSVAGEQLRISAATRSFFTHLPECRFWNHYGPTETHVVTSFEMVGDAKGWPDLPPIGDPLLGCRIHLLDEHLAPVSPGAAGELYVGGACLARGYRNRPDLTSDRFIRDPFASDPEAFLYRTGDLARKAEDGPIEFLGRADQQVKVRGHRVEPGEIEAVLSAHPRVSHCSVLMRDGGAAGGSLVAFIVLRGKESPSVEILRGWMVERLPEYMIPAHFFAIPSLPLTPNGKVDQRALLAFEGVELGMETRYAPPRTDAERAMHEAWQALLAHERIGIHDDFFTLGGHSLLAVAIVSRVGRAIGAAIPVRWLFENPTIAGLCRQIESRRDVSAPASTVQPIDRSGPWPASFAQQGMWLSQQMLPDPATYNQAFTWRFRDTVDPDRIRRALRKFVERHEVLRTALVIRDGQLMQEIADASNLSLPWKQIDLREVPPSERQAELERRLTVEARRPFDMAEVPLWRAAWITLGNDDHVLSVTIQHSIVDAWSIRLFCQEMETIDGALNDSKPDGLPELPIRYAAYSAWERERLDGDTRERCRAYWVAQLRDLPAPLELATDRPRPMRPSGRGAIHEFRIAADVTARLKDLAREESSTLFTLVLAGFQVLLARQTGQTDLVVITPSATRSLTEAHPLFGCFLNTLPVRARLDGTPGFRDVLRQVRQTLLEAYTHAELPFEQIVELIPGRRKPGLDALFPVMFVLVEDDTPPLVIGDAEGLPLRVHTETSKCELTLDVQAADDEWLCRFEYAVDLFDGETVSRLAGHLTELLRSIAVDPDRAIGRLNLMGEVERHRVVVEWNTTRLDYPREACIHQLFEEQARRTPDAVAVALGDRTLTYEELDRQAECLSRHLRSLGVEPGDLVGLGVERSFERIIGLLGILKAGAAYWAWEENLPDERLGTLLRDASPRLLLVRRDQSGHLQSVKDHVSVDHPGVVGEIAQIEGLLESVPPGSIPPARASRADDPAYVSYTSGSTGQPKGVVVPHRGVVRLVIGSDYASLTAEETLLHLSPLSFDASTFEIWGALLNGGRLVLAPPGQLSLGEIGDVIRQHRVSTLWLTAALFHLMVDENPDDLKGLRQLLAGGDVLSVDHVRRARQTLPGTRIINGYGPTENTTFTCCYSVPPGGDLPLKLPIGRPIANTRVYVLDDAGEPVPIGVAGELHAGGDGVALGYLNRHELTASKFVPDRFASDAGAQLYQTGDIVRWRPDGDLEFLGRRDAQVKIRGYRVEPGETEAALRNLAEVREAAVTVREEGVAGKVLAAHVVLAHGYSPDEARMRATLQSRLPTYMIPAWIEFVDVLPMTPSGKLDRGALAVPSRREKAEVGPGRVARPRTLLELDLTRIWRQLFQREDIGPEDNFFHLGGNSLLAAQLVVKVEDLIGRRVPIAALFQSPTIASLTRMLSDANWAPSWNSLVPVQPLGSGPAVFCIHGRGGEVYDFLDLARELAPERKVYGLQAIGLDGAVPRHESVEDMAALYVREIRQTQPEGPYHLLGHSLGGWIAYAVAQEMRRQGMEVGMLGLLDTRGSCDLPVTIRNLERLSDLKDRISVHLKQLRNMSLIDRTAYLGKRWKGMRSKLAKWRRQVSPDVDRAIAPEMDHFQAVAARYRPAKYLEDLQLFVGEDVTGKGDTLLKRLVRGRVRVHRVPGDHMTMIDRDHARDFARVFRRALSEVEG